MGIKLNKKVEADLWKIKKKRLGNNRPWGLTISGCGPGSATCMQADFKVHHIKFMMRRDASPNALDGLQLLLPLQCRHRWGTAYMTSSYVHLVCSITGEPATVGLARGLKKQTHVKSMGELRGGKVNAPDETNQCRAWP